MRLFLSIVVYNCTVIGNKRIMKLVEQESGN